eukprot:3250777-Pyramimonas_sp.AAC.1
MQTWAPLWVNGARECEPHPASWEFSRILAGDADAGGSLCPRGGLQGPVNGGTPIGRLDAHAELPPITLEQLDRVLQSDPANAGLGRDKFHPRQMAYLPDSHRQAFLDILHAWERAPEDQDLWTLPVFFLSKPNPPGGVRPIVLFSLWTRAWSRCRQ